MKTYLTEYPDFTMPSEVTIPTGFKDLSQGTEDMPHWRNEERNIDLWISYDPINPCKFYLAFNAWTTNEDCTPPDSSVFKSYNFWHEVTKALTLSKLGTVGEAKSCVQRALDHLKGENS